MTAIVRFKCEVCSREWDTQPFVSDKLANRWLQEQRPQYCCGNAVQEEVVTIPAAPRFISRDIVPADLSKENKIYSLEDIAPLDQDCKLVWLDSNNVAVLWPGCDHISLYQRAF